MKYINYKNIFRIKTFKKLEFFKIFYKSLFFNLSLSNFIRSYFYSKLFKLLNLSRSSFKFRCFKNFYSRNLVKQYNLSRFFFKYYSNNGYISGLKRI